MLFLEQQTKEETGLPGFLFFYYCNVLRNLQDKDGFSYAVWTLFACTIPRCYFPWIFSLLLTVALTENDQTVIAWYHQGLLYENSKPGASGIAATQHTASLLCVHRRTHIPRKIYFCKFRWLFQTLTPVPTCGFLPPAPSSTSPTPTYDSAQFCHLSSQRERQKPTGWLRAQPHNSALHFRCQPQSGSAVLLTYWLWTHGFHDPSLGSINLLVPGTQETGFLTT